MKPKLIVGILFVIIFIFTFIAYLLVVNVIAPKFDLSSTAKQDLEISPELEVDKNAHESYVNSGLNSTELNERLENVNNENAEKVDNSVNVPGSAASSEEKTTAEESSAQDEDENTTETKTKQDNKNSQQDLNKNKPVAANSVSTSNVSKVSIPFNNPKISASSNSNAPAAPIAPLPRLDRPLLDKKVSPSGVSRVYVGSYDNVDQAKQAYDKVLNSGTEVTPIIKQVGGKYSLQVGAFSDQQKAKNLADRLKQQNLSAKVKSE